MDTDWTLLDSGINFTIVSQDTDVDMNYGDFAISLANTNPLAIRCLLEHFLRESLVLKVAQTIKSVRGKDMHISYESASKILEPLYPLVFKLLSKSYLNVDQAMHVSILLMLEITHNLSNKPLNLDNPTIYIPDIFADKELHKHLRNMLLRKNSAFSEPLQAKINKMVIKSSIQTIECGDVNSVYYPQTTLEYLILDLQKYLKSGRYVKECLYCERLFIPKYRKNEKYCRLPNPLVGKTCNEFIHHRPNDKFAVLRNRARGYQHSRCYNESTKKKYNEEFLLKSYSDWTQNCKEQYLAFKTKGDLSGFQLWIDKTKFTSKRLEELWSVYSKEVVSPT